MAWGLAFSEWAGENKPDHILRTVGAVCDRPRPRGSGSLGSGRRWTRGLKQLLWGLNYSEVCTLLLPPWLWLSARSTLLGSSPLPPEESGSHLVRGTQGSVAAARPQALPRTPSALLAIGTNLGQGQATDATPDLGLLRPPTTTIGAAPPGVTDGPERSSLQNAAAQAAPETHTGNSLVTVYMYTCTSRPSHAH